MAKCGCAGDACSCKVIAGHGVRVSGAGTINNPYRIDAYPVSVTVLDTSSVNLTLAGSGTEADPYVISGEVGGTLFDGYWKEWFGTETARAALGSYDAGTLYAVTGP